MPAASLFLAAFGVGIALLLLLAARGLWRGRRWARSPVIMWQILLVVLALGWLGAEASVLGGRRARRRARWSASGLLLPPVVAVTAAAVEGPAE